MPHRLSPSARRIAPIILALSVQFPATGHCADSAPTRRAELKGSPYFLDETAIKISNDIATFKLYTSAEVSDPGTDATLNCVTREFSARNGEQWSTPFRVLAGESLYPVGKKLCDWDAKGFFQRFSF